MCLHLCWSDLTLLTTSSYCAKRLLRPGPRKWECPSVRPSVRPCVCPSVCVSVIFTIFAKGIWTPNTLRSPSQNEHFCVSDHIWNSIHVCYLLCPNFMITFLLKNVFLSKKYPHLPGTKTCENHQNWCSLTVWFWSILFKKYSFRVETYVTQRMTSQLFCCLLGHKASRHPPAGCCLVERIIVSVDNVIFKENLYIVFMKNHELWRLVIPPDCRIPSPDSGNR